MSLQRHLMTRADLDKILHPGDELYISIITDLKLNDKFVNDLLMFDDLPHTVFINPWHYGIKRGQIYTFVISHLAKAIFAIYNSHKFLQNQ